MPKATIPKVKPEFDAAAIDTRIKELAAEIRAEAGDGEVFLLCILKGAAVFCADLMRSIPGQVGYGFIDVVRDIADTEIATALEIDFLSHTALAGRDVYVLKDVVTTGVIENYLLSQLRLHNPASLRLVALLDRPNLRTVDITTDHRAFEVGDGTYVGYGLEQDTRFGNLPYIGRL
ncbi:MAG TPA: phosphoribosyltransferase family protein [Thermoanaerobaculia bacterium]|nr:phosphoribosyltransferase family protein [Thermoanaerobaculia bacterium]